MNLIAVLTAPGTSALATIALHGDGAWSALRERFRPELPAEPVLGTLNLGRLGREVGDEVVVVSGESGVEIHCHGGREVVRFLVELFLERGFVEVDWQQFLRRTRAPRRALAEIALTQATTARVANILLDQVRGNFDPVQLAESARWAWLGRRLLAGFRVVLAGPPNVGKSSLANALAGYQRSIVSPTPGTTRDVVTARLAFDGWPIELSDTAGLRTEADVLESAGIERTRASLDTADLVVWLMDASDPNPVPPERPGTLVVVNKIDRPAMWTIPADALSVSATTGFGMEALTAAIVVRLVPEVPPPGTAIPLSPESLEEA